MGFEAPSGAGLLLLTPLYASTTCKAPWLAAKHELHAADDRFNRHSKATRHAANGVSRAQHVSTQLIFIETLARAVNFIAPKATLAAVIRQFWPVGAEICALFLRLLRIIIIDKRSGSFMPAPRPHHCAALSG